MVSALSGFLFHNFPVEEHFAVIAVMKYSVGNDVEIKFDGSFA